MQFEKIITAVMLAKMWQTSKLWVESHTRDKSDPIPHLRFGRCIRYAWGSAELNDWMARRQVAGRQYGSVPGGRKLRSRSAAEAR